MRRPTTALRIPTYILSMLTLTACGPSQEEIQEMIAASNAQLRQELIEANVVDSEEEKRMAAEVEAAKPNWCKSMEFLGTLNEVMQDYEPIFEEDIDSTDLLACTTSYEFSMDPELKRGARSLFKQQRSAERERANEEQAFERGKWKQYQLDYAWKERIDEHPTVYACKLLGKWVLPGSAQYSKFNTRAKCNDSVYNDIKWAMYSQEKESTSYYTGRPISENGAMSPPVLMTKIQQNSITVPDRFHCLVSDVEKGSKDEAYIYCRGNRPAGSYIRVTGEIGTIHKGDAVSVPLKGTAQPQGGVLSKVDRRLRTGIAKVWMISADAGSIQRDDPATCPSRDEILEGAANNR